MSSNGLKVWKSTKVSILKKLGWITLQIFDQLNSRLESWTHGNSKNFRRTKIKLDHSIFSDLERETLDLKRTKKCLTDDVSVVHPIIIIIPMPYISFIILQIKKQKQFRKYLNLTLKNFLSKFFIALKRAWKERFNFYLSQFGCNMICLI